MAQSGLHCVAGAHEEFPNIHPYAMAQTLDAVAALARQVAGCVFAMIQSSASGALLADGRTQPISWNQGDARWLKDGTNRLRHI